MSDKCLRIRIGIPYLHVNVRRAAGVHVEVDDFWAEARLHLGVHLVAALHQLFGQLQVLHWQAVVVPQSQCARQEAHKMVLTDEETQRQV